MCRNARISMTTGFVAALILALSPLAARAKNSGAGYSTTSHPSGNKSTSGKPNNTMHMAPYTKVSHDSSKPQHDYKHKDSEYCHTDRDSHDYFCKHDDHYCKDYCHDHCYHDHCRPCGFCWDFPCISGCDYGCDCGPTTIINDNDNLCDGDDTVVIDQ